MMTFIEWWQNVNKHDNIDKVFWEKMHGVDVTLAETDKGQRYVVTLVVWTLNHQRIILDLMLPAYMANLF